MIERRSFITGLVSLIAAPAIVRAGLLMPVKVLRPDFSLVNLAEYEGGRQVQIAVMYGSLKIGDWVTFNVGDCHGPIEPCQFRVTATGTYDPPRLH